MAVITRYVVVRNGVELDRVFEIKREAEAFDKMLDAAERLAQFIKSGNLEVDLDDRTIDAISVFLAKNGPEVTAMLRGIKPASVPVKTPENRPAEPAPGKEQKKSTKKPAGRKGK